MTCNSYANIVTQKFFKIFIIDTTRDNTSNTNLLCFFNCIIAHKCTTHNYLIFARIINFGRVNNFFICRSKHFNFTGTFSAKPKNTLNISRFIFNYYTFFFYNFYNHAINKCFNLNRNTRFTK